MERPSLTDPSLLTDALEVFLPRILEWAGSDAQEERILQTLRETYNAKHDGYFWAKALGGAGWRPNAKLVTLLETFPRILQTLYDARVEAWVHEHYITPDLDIGAEVQVDGKPGTIMAVAYKEARYQVRFGKRIVGVPYEQVSG